MAPRLVRPVRHRGGPRNVVPHRPFGVIERADELFAALVVASIEGFADRTKREARPADLGDARREKRRIEAREIDICLDPTADLAEPALRRPRERVGVRRIRARKKPRRSSPSDLVLARLEERAPDASPATAARDADPSV